MKVFKTNVLVEPINYSNSGVIKRELSSTNTLVDKRLNSGKVISISDSVQDIKVGEVVGYSTLDGVDVKMGNKTYILLSHREIQAVILKDYDNVRFGYNDRELITDHHVAKRISGNKGAML